MEHRKMGPTRDGIQKDGTLRDETKKGRTLRHIKPERWNSEMCTTRNGNQKDGTQDIFGR